MKKRSDVVAVVLSILLATIGCSGSDKAIDGGSGSIDGSVGDIDGGGGGDDGGGGGGAIIADHTKVGSFASIPSSYFDQIRSSYSFFYGHTSHGSQIITGLDILASEDGTGYAKPTFVEEYGDLGSYGDLTWVGQTTEALDPTVSGQMALLMLALTTILAGVHFRPRLAVIGGIQAATFVAAVIAEEFFWVLLILILVAVVIDIVWRSRKR